jgi:hypothetical protein
LEIFSRGVRVTTSIFAAQTAQWRAVIPPILHQSWINADVPERLAVYARTWRALHPDWDYRLWTDHDLRDFVGREHPHMLELFDRYPKPIMRVDLARCLLLKTHGGIYADLDTEPLRSLDGLRAGERPLLWEEPASHGANEFVRARGFADQLLSNACMLSPAGDPFWDRLLDLMQRCQHAANPLDATGPFLLTAAVHAAPPGVRPWIGPAYQLSPVDKYGNTTARPDHISDAPLVQHHWHGTWWKEDPDQPIQHRPTPAPRAAPPARPSLLQRLWPRRPRALPEGPARGDHVLLAIPVRNAAATLPALFDRLLALTHPAHKRSLAFIEGDSTDSSPALLKAFCREHRDAFARVTLLRHHERAPTYQRRWEPRHQRERRARIARIRNRLLKKALGREDWVLWLDADIIEFPPTLIADLLAVGAPVVHPNCVLRRDGPSFDLNAWISERTLSPEEKAPFMQDGLYQPPMGFHRLYLSDLRYRDRIPLHSVGGTTLLVDARLHRAGYTFPATPRDGLIETEAFAANLQTSHIPIIGLPNYEVQHAPRTG